MKNFIKTFNRVMRIIALVTTILASGVSFATGDSSEGIAWGCCALWVANTMLVQIQLNKLEEKHKE